LVVTPRPDYFDPLASDGVVHAVAATTKKSKQYKNKEFSQSGVASSGGGPRSE
jgi:hypothetical protein